MVAFGVFAVVRHNAYSVANKALECNDSAEFVEIYMCMDDYEKSCYNELKADEAQYWSEYEESKAEAEAEWNNK